MDAALVASPDELCVWLEAKAEGASELWVGGSATATGTPCIAWPQAV